MPSLRYDPFHTSVRSDLGGATPQSPYGTYYYDFYPDTLVMAGFLHPSSIITKIMRRANTVMYEWLDAVVTIGRDMNVLLMATRACRQADSLHPKLATLPIRYRNITEKFLSSPLRQQISSGHVWNAGFTHDPNSVFEAAQIWNT